jgi:hypothetical protein
MEYGLSYSLKTGNTIGGIPSRSHLRDFSSAEFDTLQSSGASITQSEINFVWNGDYSNDSVPLGADFGTGNITPAIYDRGLFMHVNHPLIQNGPHSLSINEIIANGIVSMPKYAVKRSLDKSGQKQAPYQPLTIEYIDGTTDGPKNEQGVEIARKAIKNSFTEDDQYLLGGKSCGSFLYLSPTNQNTLAVDAPSKFGKKLIEGGSQNAVSVDMVFQYRMTDYYGKGDSGRGRIAGIYGNRFSNLIYSKKIGLDIIDSYRNEFRFDIEIYAKYRAVGTNKNSINKIMLSKYNSGSGSSWWNNRRRFFTDYNDFNSSRLYDFDARPYR